MSAHPLASTHTRSADSPSLTPREAQVLDLVLRGLENKAIAAELGIVEQSVKSHVSALFRKFGVPNRAALAEVATRVELTGGLGIDRDWIAQLFRAAGPQICVLRGPELRFETVNEAFTLATGRRPVIGRTLRDAFPELDGQGVIEQTEEVFASGQTLVIHERTTSWDRGQGIEARKVDLVIQALRDDEGIVNGVLSFAVDVTDSVSARERARVVPDEIAGILDLVPSGVLVTDDEGRLIRSNAAAQRILGTPMELSPSLGAPIARALRGESVPPTELTLVRGGSGQSVRVRVSALPRGGPVAQIRGAVVVFTELD